MSLRFGNPGLRHLFRVGGFRHETDRVPKDIASAPKEVIDVSRQPVSLCTQSTAPEKNSLRPPPVPTSPETFEDLVSELTLSTWKRYRQPPQKNEGIPRGKQVNESPFTFPRELLVTNPPLPSTTCVESEAAELFVRILVSHKNRRMGWSPVFLEGTDLAHYLGELVGHGGGLVDPGGVTREGCLRLLFDEHGWLFEETLSRFGGGSHTCGYQVCTSPLCESGRRRLDCGECGCHPHSFPRGTYFFSSLGQPMCATGTVFVCPMTGLVHVCDDVCLGSLSRRGDEYVCTFSGLSKGPILSSAAEKVTKDVYRDICESVETREYIPSSLAEDEEDIGSGGASVAELGPPVAKKRRRYSRVTQTPPDMRGLDDRAGALVNSLGKTSNPMWEFMTGGGHGETFAGNNGTPPANLATATGARQPPPEERKTPSPRATPKKKKQVSVDASCARELVNAILSCRVTWSREKFKTTLRKVAQARMESLRVFVKKRKNGGSLGYSSVYSIISTRFQFAGAWWLIAGNGFQDSLLDLVFVAAEKHFQVNMRAFVDELVRRWDGLTAMVLRKVIDHVISMVQQDDQTRLEWFSYSNPRSAGAKMPSPATQVIKEWLPILRVVVPLS